MSRETTSDRETFAAGEVGRWASRGGAVARLLRAVRRRLWLEATVQGAYRGIWLGALLAGCGAVVHLSREAHPFVPALVLAVASATVWTAAAAVSGRPAWHLSAAEADARFGGRDLIASAADLLGRPRSSWPRASRFVLESADAHARRWLGELEPLRQSLRPARFFAPCALLGVFLFLYGLPGAVASEGGGGEAASSGVAAEAGTSLRADAPVVDPDDALDVWARSGRDEESEASPAGGTEADASDEAASARDAGEGPVSPAGSRAAVPVAAPEIGAGGTAGDAPKVETAATLSEPSPELTVRFIELARLAGDAGSASSAGVGRELEDPSGTPGAGRESSIPIGSGSAAVWSRAGLPLDLRAYVSEYEARLRAIP